MCIFLKFKYITKTYMFSSWNKKFGIKNLTILAKALRL